MVDIDTLPAILRIAFVLSPEFIAKYHDQRFSNDCENLPRDAFGVHLVSYIFQQHRECVASEKRASKPELRIIAPSRRGNTTRTNIARRMAVEVLDLLD